MDFPIFSDYSKKIPRKGSGLYYDPLYGYVPLPSYCREAMDLEVFQRLRGIKQLSTVYLTFPGALHTRFDHCVGTSHLASIMFNKLRELVNPDDTNAPKINHITEACMQLSSLFHDTGHGPFGHIFEMFCKRREKFRKWRHEEFGRKLITGKDKRNNELKGREFEQIPEFLNKLKSAFQKKYGKVENLSLLDPPNIYKIGYGKSPDLGSKKLNNKYDFLKDIIASSYGLDRLDYLKRDAYFSGVNTGNIDIGEIISNLLLYRFENKYQLFLKTDAAPALEALLQARNLVYRRLYHNNVNRSAQELIIRGLIELACNPEDVCLLTDNELLYRFFNDGDFPVEINERIKFRILFENLEICNHSFIRKFEEGLKDYVEKPDKWLVLKSKEDSIAKKVDMDKGKVFYDIEVIPAVRGEDFNSPVFFDEVENKPKSLFDLAKHLDVIYGKDPYTKEDKSTSFNYTVSIIYVSFPFDEIQKDIKKLTEIPKDKFRSEIERVYRQRLEPMIKGFFDEILSVSDKDPKFYKERDTRSHFSNIKEKFLNYLSDLVKLEKGTNL